VQAELIAADLAARLWRSPVTSALGQTETSLPGLVMSALPQIPEAGARKRHSGGREESINSTQTKSALLTRKYQTFRGVVVRRQPLRTFRHTVVAFLPRSASTTTETFLAAEGRSLCSGSKFAVPWFENYQGSASMLTTIGANGLVGDRLESEACMRAPF
jgi:hypothetical protein